jgi:hypothetical protein
MSGAHKHRGIYPTKNYQLARKARQRTPGERRMLEPPRTLQHACSGPCVFALVCVSVLVALIVAVPVLWKLLPMIWVELLSPFARAIPFYAGVETA